LAPPDGLFGAARLTLRVALRAINFACGEVVEPAFLCRRFEFTPTDYLSRRKSLAYFYQMARPDGFEPPTTWFEA